MLHPGGSVYVEVDGLSLRYLCTVDSQAAAGYVWTAALIGYIAPIVVVLATLIAATASAVHHRRKLAASRVYSRSSAEPGTPAGDSGPIQVLGGHRPVAATSLTVEVDAAKFLACLLAVWCVVVLPFPVLSLVRVGRTAALPSRAFTYATQVDALVVGLFVSYPLLLPLVTVIWRRHVCSRCVHRARTCAADGVAAADDESPAVTPRGDGGVRPEQNRI